MFKEGFDFSKKAWHARLMKYIWNLSHKDFDYMCPYFWLSVFNVIIAPVFVPTKFILKTILFGIILKQIWGFIKWCYEGIEGSLEAMGDKLDDWAIQEQRKWEEKRKAEIANRSGYAMQVLSNIPDEILEMAEKVAVRGFWDLRYSDQELYREFEKQHAKDKRFQKFWSVLLGEIYKDRSITKEIIQEKDRLSSFDELITIKHEKVPETKEHEEKRVKRAEEKRLKEQEKERVRKLREEEAKEIAKENNRKYQLRMQMKAEIRIRNKQRINKILKIVKPIGTAFIWLVGIAVAFFGLYFLIILISFIIEAFSSVKHSTYVSISKFIVDVIVYLVVGAAGLLTILGIAKLGIYLKEQYRKRYPFREVYIKRKPEELVEPQEIRYEKVERILIAIGSIFPPIWRVIKYIAKFVGKILKLIFITPFVKIWKGFKILIQIIVQTYNDNCPPIRWKD